MSKTLGTLREYETVFVINPDLTEDVVSDLIARFRGIIEKQGGTLLREDRWGKRKMAYEMKKNPRGNYILLHYVAEHTAVAEVERIARNSDAVIRFITDLKGPVKDVDAKKAEVERLVREKSAEKARLEQERAAAAAAEAAGGEEASAARG
jgi:small subunit ribosomal protein S6